MPRKGKICTLMGKVIYIEIKGINPGPEYTSQFVFYVQAEKASCEDSLDKPIRLVALTDTVHNSESFGGIVTVVTAAFHDDSAKVSVEYDKREPPNVGPTGNFVKTVFAGKRRSPAPLGRKG